MKFHFRLKAREEGGYLDQIRIERGDRKCVRVFRRTCEIDLKHAMDYLNDPKLSYATLYLLLESIREQSLYSYLSERNVMALLMTNQITAKDHSAQRVNYLASPNEAQKRVLRWMIQTGCVEKEPDKEYQQVMDVLLSVCVNHCPEENLLPRIVPLIFQRERQGQPTHRLVEILLGTHIEAGEREQFIAPYLYSPQESERRLANRLLDQSRPAPSIGATFPQENDRNPSQMQRQVTPIACRTPRFCYACGAPYPTMQEGIADDSASSVPTQKPHP